MQQKALFLLKHFRIEATVRYKDNHFRASLHLFGLTCKQYMAESYYTEHPN